MPTHRMQLPAPALRSVLAAACLLGPGAARAHDTWADGTPAPAWVMTACCGPSDAHHLRPDQVHRVLDGVLIDDHPRTISDSQILPSQGGEYSAFYGETRAQDGERPVTSAFCFFAPSWG